MENKIVKQLQSLQTYESDSPFVKYVVAFLEKQKDYLEDLTSDDRKQVITRINIILSQLEITRLSKDDSALRNACIKASKGLEPTLWRYRDFKQGLTDIINSDIPLVLSANQEAVKRLSREKLKLLEGFNDAEAITFQLTQDNADLKAKILILEKDLPVLQQAAELEKKFNSELSIENKKLMHLNTVLRARISELESSLEHYKQTDNREIPIDDFVKGYHNSMRFMGSRNFMTT